MEPNTSRKKEKKFVTSKEYLAQKNFVIVVNNKVVLYIIN